MKSSLLNEQKSSLYFLTSYSTREQEQIAVRPEASKEITFVYLSLELKEKEELPKQTASQMYVFLNLPLGPRLRPN